MSNGTKRAILRWIHLVFTIPILGYIYGPSAQVQQYAPAVRFVFVPAIMFSGIWMYAGAPFAAVAVAVWLGVYYLSNSGAAILSLAALLVARKVWLAVRGSQPMKQTR